MKSNDVSRRHWVNQQQVKQQDKLTNISTQCRCYIHDIPGCSLISSLARQLISLGCSAVVIYCLLIRYSNEHGFPTADCWNVNASGSCSVHVLDVLFRIYSVVFNFIMLTFFYNLKKKYIVQSCTQQLLNEYCTICNIRCTESPNLNVSHPVLQLSVPYPVKPGVKSRMKM